MPANKLAGIARVHIQMAKETVHQREIGQARPVAQHKIHLGKMALNSRADHFSQTTAFILHLRSILSDLAHPILNATGHHLRDLPRLGFLLRVIDTPGQHQAKKIQRPLTGILGHPPVVNKRHGKKLIRQRFQQHGREVQHAILRHDRPLRVPALQRFDNVATVLEHFAIGTEHHREFSFTGSGQHTIEHAVKIRRQLHIGQALVLQAGAHLRGIVGELGSDQFVILLGHKQILSRWRYCARPV